MILTPNWTRLYKASAASLFIVLGGCTGEDKYVIRADDAQIGKGATIAMMGKKGQLRVPSIPGWPNGIDTVVTETESLNGIVEKGWSVSGENHVELKFIIAGGRYICSTCQSYGLPMNWHRDAAPE